VGVEQVGVGLGRGFRKGAGTVHNPTFGYYP